MATLRNREHRCKVLWRASEGAGTALIENIWREKIRGCSYSGGSAAAVNLGSPESPLSADSDQLPLRRHDGPID